MGKITLERVSNCPSCDSPGSEFWSKAHDRLHRTSDQTFEYRRCLNCHTVFQALRPVQSEIWRCYPSDYGPHSKRGAHATWSHMPRVIDRILSRLADTVVGGPAFRAKLAEAERLLSQAGTMLDFGCGAGKYLDRARKLGCVSIGMDFSPQAIEQVRSRGHTALAVDDASWSTISAESIGFVRMNHVVEHLYDPRTILAKLHAVMKSDAVLHISTPNPDGYSATKYRDAWFGLDCPRHIALLPPQCLENILRKIGFDRIEIIPDPHPKDLVRSWAYRRMDRGVMKASQDVTSLVSDGVLNLYFGSRMARAFAQGHSLDRYHLIARKRA